ncbi:hypothetical protein M885DRAFT_187129 [Pelagophyceae sp. CCMP2097]|nr:hypothetical protein M885DRAFT_187129 [Pelagophyceae sp. CCMP2097]
MQVRKCLFSFLGRGLLHADCGRLVSGRRDARIACAEPHARLCDAYTFAAKNTFACLRDHARQGTLHQDSPCSGAVETLARLRGTQGAAADKRAAGGSSASPFAHRAWGHPGSLIGRDVPDGTHIEAMPVRRRRSPDAAPQSAQRPHRSQSENGVAPRRKRPSLLDSRLEDAR